MDKFLTFDNNHNPTEKYYEKLSKQDKEIVDKFEQYLLINSSSRRAQKGKSNVIRLIMMSNKPINKLNLEDLENFIRILNKTNLSDYFKNDVRGYVQRFLKWYFKDWSSRFNNLEVIKYLSEPQRKTQITPEDILSKEDVEKLIKAENEIFWKTFLIVQYQGALRTQETRFLKWSQINMEDNEVYWLNVLSRKNKHGQERERTSPPLDEHGIYYINELKKLQNDLGIKSLFVFPSKKDVNKPISSPTTNAWFRRLTKKVLGKSKTNYLLRHSRGEYLHTLIREGKLSKENALLMMGHSERMFDKTYSHTNKKELLKLLKKQILNIDFVEPEKKLELETQIEQLKNELQKVREENEKSNKRIFELIKTKIDKLK